MSNVEHIDWDEVDFSDCPDVSTMCPDGLDLNTFLKLVAHEAEPKQNSSNSRRAERHLYASVGNLSSAVKQSVLEASVLVRNYVYSLDEKFADHLDAILRRACRKKEDDDFAVKCKEKSAELEQQMKDTGDDLSTTLEKVLGAQYERMTQEPLIAANARSCGICGGSADLRGDVNIQHSKFYLCKKCGAVGDTTLGIFSDLRIGT